MASTPACVYLTPVLGGYLADRLLGQRRTVVIGASLMAVGHFMMAFEPLFLLRTARAHPRQRRVQAQHFDASRRRCIRPAIRGATAPSRSSTSASISARSSPPGLRHARRGARLALRLRRRRHRHDHRPCRSTFRRSGCCRRMNEDGGCERPRPEAAARPRRVERVGALVVLFLPVDAVLGRLRAAGQHHRALGGRSTPIARSIFCLALRDSGHVVPVVQSVLIFAFAPLLAFWRVRPSADASLRPSQDGLGCFGLAAAISDHGRRRARGTPAARQHALAPRLFRRADHRRTLPLADRPFAGHQGGPGPRSSR